MIICLQTLDKRRVFMLWTWWSLSVSCCTTLGVDIILPFLTICNLRCTRVCQWRFESTHHYGNWSGYQNVGRRLVSGSGAVRSGFPSGIQQAWCALLGQTRTRALCWWTINRNRFVRELRIIGRSTMGKEADCPCFMLDVTFKRISNFLGKNPIRAYCFRWLPLAILQPQCTTLILMILFDYVLVKGHTKNRIV